MRTFSFRFPGSLILKTSFLLGMVFLHACSSAPKMSSKAMSAADAENWLNQYCSKLPEWKTAGVKTELTGDLVLRAGTREFKGVYPGGIHFSSPQDFTFELTNILGGTLARMDGHADHLDLTIPAKPRYSRKNIQTYLGLPVPILMQLFHGDLPCPEAVAGKRSVHVGNGQITVDSAQWRWIFDRTENGEPNLVTLYPLQAAMVNASPASVKVELSVEDWDRDANYAKKVEVTSPEGKLKWTWRNRSLNGR